MQLKNQVFRGDGYLKQLFGLSTLLYLPFDEIFKEKLGFSYTCCEKVMIYILKEYSLRVSKAFKEKNKITNIIRSLWTTVRNRQILINPSISAGYIFRISKEKLYKEYGQEEIDNLIEFLGIKIGDSSLKPAGISDFKPLYERPFIDFGRYIYLPLPESTLMNLPKLFHYKFIASNIFEKHSVEL